MRNFKLNPLHNKTKQVEKDIRDNEGKIFTVRFIKDGGAPRTLNGRLGVKAPLKGGKSTTAHIDELMAVWDNQKGNYRNVRMCNVLSISSQGRKIEYFKEEDVDFGK